MTHPDSAEKTKTILSGLSFAYPGAKVIGGAAGKASPDHGAGVFMFSSIKATEDKQACMGSTAVGLALEGNMAIDAVVAQGSRPIGPSFEVVEVADDGLTIRRLRDTVTGTDMEGPPMTLFDMYAGPFLPWTLYCPESNPQSFCLSPPNRTLLGLSAGTSPPLALLMS
jgi:small ligand-binding sensory domain FIST